MPFPKSLLALLLALALMRGVIYASIIPPWQAPDEPAQFERVKASFNAVDWRSTAENGPDWYRDLAKSLFTYGYWDFVDTARQPYTADTPLNRYVVLYQEAYDGTYGSRPPYALIGWPLLLTSNQSIGLQLYLVRLNTVLMNAGIVLLAYLITRTIFPGDRFLTLGVPVLILFNPQHTHLLSTVNNGNLAELLTAAALFFIVQGIVKGFSWSNGLAILAFSLLAMWTKATAYFLPFAIGSIGLFYLWRYRQHWRWLLPAGLVLAGLVYFFAPERLRILISMGWSHLKSGNLYLDPIVPIDLFRSFWAMPGWIILPLHPFWYWLLAMACMMALVGLVILVVTRRDLLFLSQFQPRVQALIVLAVAVIVAIGTLLSWNALTNSIVYRQGRSIYPVMVPIALFLMLGWRQLIPPPHRKFGLLAVASGLFLFDTLVLFHYIIPFFYSRY